MAAGPDARVLLLGGGDGLALREVLRHRGVRTVRLVDADPALPRLARTDPGLAALGGRSLDDPRVRTTAADPLAWLRGAGAPGGDGPYDVVLADLPAPADGGPVKFHSQEFYGLAARLLSPGGRIAVRAGNDLDGLWQIESGLRTTGLQTAPYAVPGSATAACRPGPPDDPQNFLLAAATRPPLTLAPDAPSPRALTPDTLHATTARLTALRPAHPRRPSPSSVPAEAARPPPRPTPGNRLLGSPAPRPWRAGAGCPCGRPRRWCDGQGNRWGGENPVVVGRDRARPSR